MSPFDLRGPSFLIFYLVLASLVIGAAILLQHLMENGPVPRFEAPDPYLIAYLRGGANEALRVTTFSLLDRGLLKMEGPLVVTEQDAVARVRRPIERAVLEELRTPKDGHAVLSSSQAQAACGALATELQAHGLIVAPFQIVVRILIGLFAVVVLWGIAFTKIGIALSRGHHNVVVLLFFVIVTPVVIVFVLRGRRTSIGQRVIDDLQTLFARLRERSGEVAAGGATNELALLAAIYGFQALPGYSYLQAQALFHAPAKPAFSSDSSSASSCSSCGSSSASSCGSSCGGGGCGGGCGGCGS